MKVKQSQIDDLWKMRSNNIYSILINSVVYMEIRTLHVSIQRYIVDQIIYEFTQETGTQYNGGWSNWPTGDVLKCIGGMNFIRGDKVNTTPECVKSGQWQCNGNAIYISYKIQLLCDV